MPPPAAIAKSPSTRLGQGLVFLLGAVVTYVLLADEPRLFYRVPITLGIVYLVAAAVGGRDGGHWSTACVLCGWGLAVVALQDWDLDMNAASAYLAGAGLGALVAGGLERVGVSADLLGVAGTILIAGLVFGLEDDVGEVLDAATYAYLLAAVGVVNLALAFGGRR